jgi:hypothetical protein
LEGLEGVVILSEITIKPNRVATGLLSWVPDFADPTLPPPRQGPDPTGTNKTPQGFGESGPDDSQTTPFRVSGECLFRQGVQIGTIRKPDLALNYCGKECRLDAFLNLTMSLLSADPCDNKLEDHQEQRPDVILTH